MSNKLKIYACSGIGNAEYSDKPIAYWTDNTNTISNTQAVNTLLARINLLYIGISRLQSVTPEEKIECLNEIDFLCVCLSAAKRFKDDSEGLEYAGNVISKMVSDNMFVLNNLNTDTRDAHLDELIAYADEQYNDRAPITNVDPNFMQWWQETVISRNKVGLNFGQQQNIRKALKKAAETIQGIGAVSDVDWSKYTKNDNWMKDPQLFEWLTNGAEYFLYTYFTQAQLVKLPAVFAEKRIKQLKTYNYCKSLFVIEFGSEEEMQMIIRAGIINLFEAEPEDVCAEIASGKRSISGIGNQDESTEKTNTKSTSGDLDAIIDIIEFVFSAVVMIVQAICSCVASVQASKYGALDKEVIEESNASEEDFDGIKFDGNKKDNSKILTFAAIAAGLFLLLKK